MPTFAFSGRTRGGETLTGERAGDTADSVVASLRREHILVTRITAVETKAAPPKKIREKAAPARNLAVFTRQFSVMIDSGLPLVQCLEILGTQEEDKNFSAVILQTRADVEGGASLADAMKKHPRTFDALYSNMIAAGEAGGILDTILKRLATYVEKAVKLKSQVKSAMIYPAVIIIIATAVVAIILWKVIPTFASLFTGLGATLPLPTRAVIIASDLTVQFMPYLLVVLGGGLFGLRRYYASEGGRGRIDGLAAEAAVRRSGPAKDRRRALLPNAVNTDCVGGANSRGPGYHRSHRRQRDRRGCRAVDAEEYRARHHHLGPAPSDGRVSRYGGADDCGGRSDGRARHHAGEDCGLLRGGGRHGRRRHAVAARADHDRVPRNRRRRHRDLDVPADLRTDLRAGRMNEGTLSRRLLSHIALRLVAATVLLGFAWLSHLRAPGVLDLNPFYVLIASIYAVSLVFIATLRFVDRFPWLIDVHFAIDVMVVSAAVALTGGITSIFTSLYVLPIVAASTLQFRRGSLQVAALSAVLYGGMVLAQYAEVAGLIDPVLGYLVRRRTCRRANVAQYTVGLNVAGLFAVAFLSGSLAERLRRADVKLEKTSGELADLQFFNQYVIDNLVSGLATADAAQPRPDLQPISGPDHRPRARERHRPAGRRGPAASRRVHVHARRGPANGRAASEPTCSISEPTVASSISVSASRQLPMPDGRRGYLYTFQDVTESKRLERGAQMQKRLAAVGEMAAGIAHEIRNPLAAMSGSMQILRQELSLSSDQAQLMDIVLRESERLNATIRSFLAYARPQRFEVQRLDLRRVVQDTATLLRNSTEVGERHIDHVELPPTKCVSRRTKITSGRSSGISRPTACARCPMAARFACGRRTN